MEIISDYVIYFIVFAAAGYLIELVGGAIFKKKLMGRGFLFGPYLPIYGFGGILIVLTTMPFKDNLALTVVVSMLVCTALEYATSYVLEKIFKVRWWDYSKSDAFNLNGRICLRSAMMFGIGGAILSIQVFPALQSWVDSIPLETKTVISCAVVAIILVDTLISTYANGKIKYLENFGEMIGDQTMVIKKNARKVVAQKVRRKKK